MKEAFRNAIILDPEKNKHYIGDIIIEKNKPYIDLPRIKI